MSAILIIVVGLWLAKGLVEAVTGLIQIALGLICGAGGIVLSLLAIALDGWTALWRTAFPEER